MREAFLPSSFFSDDLLLTGGEISDSVETSDSGSPDRDSALRSREGLAEVAVRALLGEEATLLLWIVWFIRTWDLIRIIDASHENASRGLALMTNCLGIP